MTKIEFTDYVFLEILRGQPYDLKCDIFSLGYTMFFVMTGNIPTKTDNFGNIVKNIISNAFYNIYNKYLVDLIERMYRYNPAERPNTKEALGELEAIEENINMNNKNMNDMNNMSNMNNINNMNNMNDMNNMNNINNMNNMNNSNIQSDNSIS